MTDNIRSESDIFSDLAKICSQPGFAHVIAAICFRDNVIGIENEINAENIVGQFRGDRLIRTEISTLIGLWFRAGGSVDMVSQQTISELGIRTEHLLEELHTAIGRPLIDEMSAAKPVSNKNPFLKGEVLREPIFYGGDSAYGFQYRDFSTSKYSADNEWLIKNRKFDINSGVKIVSLIGDFQNENLKRHLLSLRNTDQSTWTMLPGFAFSAEEIAENSDYTPDQVRFVIEAFSPPSGADNSQFSKIGEFNVVNAYPIIRTKAEKYLLFHYYTLFEALYENPFFWMIADNEYKEIAAKNRGRFLEKFAYERLKTVFGASKVYHNVKLEISGKKDAGEIDVLVIFAGRILLIQAKTKRLTIEARKGNDLAIAKDFKASIQDAYDQCWLCSELILKPETIVRDDCGNLIDLGKSICKIYPICLISDHYPALSFQSRIFLRTNKHKTISQPFVSDIFNLDVLCEMLHSPLFFLSYVDKRLQYNDKIFSVNELTILSYHIRRNLWIDNSHDFVQLHEDISADLDAAMLVRREGLPGRRTPDGILTRFTHTSVGQLIARIEASDNEHSVDFGFLLLTLSEETLRYISDGIDRIGAMTINDGCLHDLTVGIGDANAGLTIHCSLSDIDISSKN